MKKYLFDIDIYSIDYQKVINSKEIINEDDLIYLRSYKDFVITDDSNIPFNGTVEEYLIVSDLHEVSDEDINMLNRLDLIRGNTYIHNIVSFIKKTIDKLQ